MRAKEFGWQEVPAIVTAFNSLFEMQKEEIEAKSEPLGDLLSILYLRCTPEPLGSPPHTAQLSILYLRCISGSKGDDATANTA